MRSNFIFANFSRPDPLLVRNTDASFILTGAGCCRGLGRKVAEGEVGEGRGGGGEGGGEGDGDQDVVTLDRILDI